MNYNVKFETLPKNPDLSETFDVYMCNDYSLPSFAINFLKNEASTYKAREDDVYIVSYPKTGTTWTQEIMYLIQSNLDLSTAKSKDLSQRFPYVEHARTDFNFVKHMPSPRLLKSHLPYSLLPPDIHDKQCKIVYVTRNPRDVAVSYYHFACMLAETGYKGTFDQFFERFINNRATYSPFLNHNLEFWNHRNDANILFLFYEDMQQDIVNNIKKVAEFLGRSLTDDEISSIKDHCSFKKMAESKTVGLSSSDTVTGKGAGFFRKGKVGDWKNYFSAEQISRLDKKVADVLGESGLSYTYEI